jgi:hypothetical protein
MEWRDWRFSPCGGSNVSKIGYSAVTAIGKAALAALSPAIRLYDFRKNRPFSKHAAFVSEARQGYLTYTFSKPVSPQRALNEFMEAKKNGRPSGSVILVD